MELARTHYLDASAIVMLFIDEPGSNALRTYFDKDKESRFYHMTNLCFGEALGVLKRYLKQKVICEEEYFYACDQLLGYAKGTIIEIEDIEIKDRMVFTEVENLIKKYNRSIDLSDAFQIVLVKRNPCSRFKSDSRPILITGDGPLAKAAEMEGIRVWNVREKPEPDRGN
jgi:predicted nucleic acid-binding protein